MQAENNRSNSYTTDATGIDAVRAQARIDLDNAWDIVEAALQEGPYFLGERYSILDPYLLMLAYWHENLTELFNRCSKLERLCNTVLDRPAVQSIWHQHYPEAWPAWAGRYAYPAGLFVLLFFGCPLFASR